MGWAGKRPLLPKIRTEANDENAVPMLRNAIVGGVEQSIDDPVEKIVLPSARMMALEPGKVFGPVLNPSG
jgi:hypothetical protein